MSLESFYFSSELNPCSLACLLAYTQGSKYNKLIARASRFSQLLIEIGAPFKGSGRKMKRCKVISVWKNELLLIFFVFVDGTLTLQISRSLKS